MLLEYDLDITYEALLMRGIILTTPTFVSKLDTSWDRHPQFITNGGVKGSYGVCDSLENLLEYYPELLYEGTDCRRFIVAMNRVSNYTDHFFSWIPDYNLGGYKGNILTQTDFLIGNYNGYIFYRYHIFEKVDK